MEGFDMLKTMQQFMELSKMLEDFAGASGGEPFGTEPQPRKESAYTHKKDELHTPALDSIKAAIPQLEPRYQRHMSIVVKLIEIQKMTELYSEAAAMTCGPGGSTWSADGWRRRMLTSIRPHLDDQKKDLIDLLIVLIELNQVTQRILR